ncbi:MAG: glycosyltransferase family 9 protein [Candidatus Latescibacteria bacterium]|nr:glycosyltransferase family 9 protein [Candidatus Latescibacterota bacterium]
MKILIIRLSSLGDVVLASTVIDALKEKLPAAALSLLVYSKYRDLYDKDRRLTDLISLPPSPASFFDLLRKLRKMRFDTILDLHCNIKSLLIRMLVPAGRKVSYRKGHWRRALMVRAARLKAPGRRRFLLAPCRPVAELLCQKTRTHHTVELFLKPLRRLGVETTMRPPRLFIQPEAAAEVEGFLSQNDVSAEQVLIGIAPGARWSAKRWTTSGFAQVCDQLLKDPNIRLIFLGNQADLDFTQQILTRMGGKPLVATGQFGLKGLVAAIGRCSLLLTNDSGPMHIATALEIPVVAIFGPTHPKLGFSPLGPRDVLLHADLRCSPCSLHGEKRCILKHRQCMEQITPETVFEAIRRVLEDNRQSSVISELNQSLTS